MLEWPAARWLGRLSYSLYLWQQFFLVGEVRALVPGLGQLQALPVNIGLTFVVASASYYFIERPAIRTGHRMAHPEAEPQAA